MQFTTLDDLDLQCAVQLGGKIDALIRRGEVTMTTEVWIPLIAEDPNFYSQTLSEDDITFAVGSGVISNGGDAPTYPIVRVHGDVSGTITLTNTTLSATVSFSGLALSSSEYMDIDMFNETVVKNNGDNLYEYIVEDDFWCLQEGDNTITISATVGGSGSRKITLSYRDAYLGI
jgi:phage-related protein